MDLAVGREVSSLFFVGQRSGGCRLWESSATARNKELGHAESSQPGVTGDKKKFPGLQEGCQRLLQFRRLLTWLKPNPRSKKLPCTDGVSRERLVYSAL